VNVSSQAGKVTLSGKVRSQEVREKIEQIAREEAGTTTVEDHTTAVPEVAPAAAAAQADATTLTGDKLEIDGMIAVPVLW
jgi:osmotically-inducible protein OsmY